MQMHQLPDILTLFKIFTDFKQCFFVSIKEDNMNYFKLTNKATTKG